VRAEGLFVGAVPAGIGNRVANRHGESIADVIKARRVCEKNYADYRQENEHRSYLWFARVCYFS
jgi:hypothetical protein